MEHQEMTPQDSPHITWRSILGGEVLVHLMRKQANLIILIMILVILYIDNRYPGRVADTARIEKEAKDTQAALQKVLGKDFHAGAWRYPGGHMSWKNLESADQKLKDMGVTWIDWNALNGDAEPASRRPTTEAGLVEFLDKSIKANKDSSIIVILMHDAENKQLTANAVGQIIDHLRSEGYEFGILK